MANPSLIIRRATVEDGKVISDIYDHYVLTDTCTYQEIPDTLEERIEWLESHGTQHPVLVAEVAGKVVGWASISPYQLRTAFRQTVEDTIYMHPDWRRQGLGSQLLQELIRQARELGHHTIIAVISSEQTGSIRTHEKLGYVEVGRMKEVGYKFSRWLDIVYMQLIL
jgi:phosphinothricin acetyltransferase